jgi:hypothetical protein
MRFSQVLSSFVGLPKSETTGEEKKRGQAWYIA